jgi:hypothetical protein
MFSVPENWRVGVGDRGARHLPTPDSDESCDDKVQKDANCFSFFDFVRAGAIPLCGRQDEAKST